MDPTDTDLREPEVNSQTAPKDGGGGAAVPDKLWVIDTTAIELTGHDAEDKAKGRGPRAHQIHEKGLLKTYIFHPGKPLLLPLPTAIQFLKIAAFQRTDENGEALPYHRQPKQPEELGAGEAFKLADNHTIADLGELTNAALMQRCLETPGGDTIRRERDGMIDFLVKAKIKKREASLETARPKAVAAARAADPKTGRDPHQPGPYDIDEYDPGPELE